jgi:hypothetical protein
MRYDSLKYQLIHERQEQNSKQGQGKKSENIDETFGPMALRHGCRGMAQKGSRFMDNGALISVRDDRLVGADRDLTDLNKAWKDHPKRVNRIDYFHKGVFPPPHELPPALNKSQSENLVERKRQHHFVDGVIQTVRTGRQTHRAPPPKAMEFWNNGVVPPPQDMSKMHLNHSQQHNIADRNRGRTFGPNGIIMTYRRETDRSQRSSNTYRNTQRQTGRESLRNGRSSAALSELQDQKDCLEAELLQLKLEKQLKAVNDQIALSDRRSSRRK